MPDIIKQDKPPFLRKVLVLSAKSILWVYLFYLFLSLIFVPLTVPWVISSQGTKILKYPVKVRAVFFNPFLLRFNLNGLAISDNRQEVMVGFDKFWVDLSFMGVFQRKIRLESIGLTGLKVNAQLLEDGKINLLSLVPPDAAKTSAAKESALPVTKPAITQAPGAAGAAENSKPLPKVVIDLIKMDNGSISFTDLTVKPRFITTLSRMSLRITGLSTNPGSEARISFQAKLDERGTISTEALIKPAALPLSFEAVIKLNDYALQVLTPYVGKYTGHKVKEGSLSLNMDYRVANNQLNASHKLLVQSFDFGDKVESKDALNLPFGLALALLEDAHDRINLSIPVTGDMSKPDFHYFHLIGQVLRNFFFKLVTKPFAFLGSIAGVEGGSEELGYVRFMPGQFNLSAAETEKLDILIKALKERPKLLLEVQGSYDPAADWKAIKEDVLDKDYRALRKESKRQEYWIYQELYQRRFGIRELWRLARVYRSKDGTYDQEKIIKEIKRQLVSEGSINKLALSALAESRAKVIYDFIVAAGFDTRRISIGDVRECQASAGVIPLELALTVFDNSSAATGNSLPADEAKQQAVK